MFGGLFSWKEDLKKKIWEDKPFNLPMTEIISLESRGAISGRTFKVLTADGRTYKMRACENEDKAKETERNVKLLPHAFPKFFGRDRNYLLFDWIKGSHLTKDTTPDECYQLGKIVGQAHSLEDIGGKTIEIIMQNMIKGLKKHSNFSDDELEHVEQRFNELASKVRTDIILEFNDLHLGNIMRDESGKIFFVDEEGFSHGVKGLGLAKPFLKNNWMTKPEQIDAFWKGYHEFHSSDYFSHDYQMLVHFMQILRSTNTKAKTGEKEEFEKHKKMLMHF